MVVPFFNQSPYAIALAGAMQLTTTVKSSFAADASVNACPSMKCVAPVPARVKAEPFPNAEVPMAAPSETAPPATNFEPPSTRTSASCPDVGSFCKIPIGLSVVAATAAA